MQTEEAGGARATSAVQPGGAEPPPLQGMQPAGSAELPLAPGVAAAVTVVSRTIRLYSDSPAAPVPGGSSPSRPLVVLLPWFGARPRSIARYLELYLPRGLDVLVVESALSHFLWPRRGLAYAAGVLGLLQDSRLFCARLLLVHAFSIGGYTFAQMMVHLSREPARHRQLAARIRGLIYDSLVTGSLGEMALGVAQMTSPPAFRPLVRGGAVLYFSLFRCCTVRYYKAALGVFFRPPLRCPVLLFYCRNDPLSDPALLQELLEGWRRAGIRVQAQGWQDSRHAAHLHRHPQEYQAVLRRFLEQLDTVLVRAKL
ncbi:transmembrane protein 53-A-like [Emydura macquarii macquarii]|uniref:transmembrane protein 53-A-like n=1 Tax=Emydura macquarii macquarii TaxID=1129001 RepID=UPI00352B7568